MYQRSMVEPFFVSEHVETMEPYIQKTVDQLLDQMIARGCKEPVDLIENFALPVPSYVSGTCKVNYYRALVGVLNQTCDADVNAGKIIYTILGVPFEDLEYLTQQNAIRTNGSGTALQAQAANQ